MPLPVATHPRLIITAQDVPRLQQWASASNPMFASGFAPALAEAGVWSMRLSNAQSTCPLTPTHPAQRRPPTANGAGRTREAPDCPPAVGLTVATRCLKVSRPRPTVCAPCHLYTEISKPHERRDVNAKRVERQRCCAPYLRPDISCST